MTLSNIETYFSEIFCCAEAKLFNSKPPEAKLKLSCSIYTPEAREGVMFILSSSILKLYFRKHLKFGKTFLIFLNPTEVNRTLPHIVNAFVNTGKFSLCIFLRTVNLMELLYHI